MKKKILKFIVFLFIITLNAQQTQFSFTGGYVNGFLHLKVENTVILDAIGLDDPSFNNSESYIENRNEAGLYFGIAAEIPLFSNYVIQSEFRYTNIDHQSLLQVPIFLKYNVSNKFSISVGPQVTYSLEEVYTELFTKFNFGLGTSVSFNINENVFIDARYISQLNNYYKEANVISRIHMLNIGLGYKF